MDGLSAAASVMAVTSLAFQVAHTTKQLLEFWESIQDAPEDIRKIKSDLEFLTKVLEHIAREVRQQSPDPLMESALRLCSDKIDTIMSLTLTLEPHFASEKLVICKWGAFRLVLKRDKFKQLRKSLDRMKETLMMVQINNIGQSSRVRATAQFGQISALAHKINSLNLETLAGNVVTTANDASDMTQHTLARNVEVDRVSKSIESDVIAFGFRNAAQTAFDKFPGTTKNDACISDSFVPQGHSMQPAPWREVVHVKRIINQEDRVVETLFGTFRISRKTSILSSDLSSSQLTSEEEQQYEHESRFSLVPPSWLVSVGFTRILCARVLQSSLSGPIIGLDTLRTVPYDSPIFELCSLGDVIGVEALLANGKASVKDVDLYGRTPLYVAAEGHHAELCRLLIRGGADRDARIYDDADRPYFDCRNPLTAIALGPRYPSYDNRRAIDVLRLFIDLIDISEEEGDEWTSGFMLMYLMSECQGTADNFVDDAVIWLIQTLGPNFRTSVDEFYLWTAMMASARDARSERMNCLLRLFGGKVNTTNVEGGYSCFHHSVLNANHLWSSLLLAAGANTHLVAFEPEVSPESETPASLALYRANTFIALQSTLRDAMVDLDDFVTLELQQVPFKGSDWTKDKLLALLSQNLDTLTFARPATYLCCAFCAGHYEIMVQPSWMLALRVTPSGDPSKDVRDIIDSSMSQGWRPRCVPSNILAARTEHNCVFSSINDYLNRWDWDMCIFCWQKMEETGIEHVVIERKFLACDRFLIRAGKGKHNEDLCRSCETKEDEAEFAKRQREKRHPQARFTADEEDTEYSPYLIHT